MPSLSRSQLVVYGAVAVALLLVGARWVRSAQVEGTPPDGASYAAGGGDGAGATEGGSLEIDEAGGEDVVVHVAGAVRSPGVYRLPTGSRVTDAVERAGGATGSGEVETINLAARLADGQQVVVPERSSTAPAGGAAIAGTGATVAEGPISLGTATVEELDTIEGIGPVTAAGIIEFRDQQGGLSSVDDLDQVSGIGPATMEALRSRLQP